MEIERKWLIDINDIPYDLSKAEVFDIEQAYISYKPTVRIRRIVNKDKYVLTIKSSSKDKGLSHEEYEMIINKDEYENLLSKKEGLVLNKTRYRIKDEYLLEIDIFHNEYEGLAYLEIEFDSVDEAKNYIAPTWVKKELTGLKGYSNACLSRGIKLLNNF